jgi:hypothetical protein
MGKETTGLDRWDEAGTVKTINGELGREMLQDSRSALRTQTYSLWKPPLGLFSIMVFPSADDHCYSGTRVRRTRVVPTPAELFKEHIVLYHLLSSL